LIQNNGVDYSKLILKKYGDDFFCVGGIDIKTNQYVRLLHSNNRYQPSNTPFNIGGIWQISFSKPNNIEEPHNEDVIVNKVGKNIKVINSTNLANFIQNPGVPIWKGLPSNLFDGHLEWTRGKKGFLPEESVMPQHSVGFWISDQDLTHYVDNGKDRYRCLLGESFPYKGTLQPLPVIPKGTLIRMSLAKWLPRKDEPEGEYGRRCYLQLSGWYL